MTLSSAETGLVARRPALAQPREASVARVETEARARFSLPPEPREAARPRPDARQPEPAASDHVRAADPKPVDRAATRDAGRDAAAKPTRDRADAPVKADPRSESNDKAARAAKGPLDAAPSQKPPDAAVATTSAAAIVAIVAEAGSASTAESSESGDEGAETGEETQAGAAPTVGAAPIPSLIPPPPAPQTGIPTPAPPGGAAAQAVTGQQAIAAKAAGAEAAGDGADAAGAEPGKPASERGFEAILSGGAVTLPAELAAAPQPAAAPIAALATSAPAEAARTAPAPQPTPLGAVPMTIGLRSLSGSSQFEIRLDPKDLGRIDVTLDIDRDRGTVTTHLVVDRPETLALLQRDAGSLQQALSQAGLDPSEGGINLSLRGDNSGGQSAESRDPGGRAPGRGGDSGGAVTDPRLFPDATPLRGLGGIDIRI